MFAFKLLEPWRTRLLWLSLGLNLFLVALVAAPHLWSRRPFGPPGFDTVIERLARRLPTPDAAAFRDAMARERPWYDMSRQRMDVARGAVADRVQQQPFDPAAVRAALDGMQDSLRESAKRFDDSLITALGTLSPEGRTQLAQTLRRHRP